MTEFDDMPKPPGYGQKTLPREVLDNRVGTEFILTRRLLAQTTPTMYARRSELYVREDADAGHVLGRARRMCMILKGERQPLSDGDVAHIVDLDANPIRKGDDLRAWCGDKLPARHTWSGLRAYATCPECRSAAADVRVGGRAGHMHRRAETDILSVMRLISDGTRNLDKEFIDAQNAKTPAPIRFRTSGSYLAQPDFDLVGTSAADASRRRAG